MESTPILSSVDLADSTLSVVTMGATLNYYILAPIALIVGVLFVSYLRHYQWPAQHLRDQLERVIAQIKLSRSNQTLYVKNNLDNIFELSAFKAAWKEYSQTLHTIGDGVDKKIYATVPAETFFSKESLVDISIKADFYRHLPGILTGVGIIGTFSGLVWGLHQFKPEGGLALQSLPLLLHEVTSAFIGSGLAILAAIFITYQEKSILSTCYRLVDDLNKEIDSIYANGTGEEYLSRLVKSAENNGNLKDALLVDIARLMTDLTERQIAAQQQGHQMLAKQISDAVRESLSEPMYKISNVVDDVSKNQREAVTGLLANVLNGFMLKFNDTFGEQVVGINQSIEKSSSTMEMVQGAMAQSIEGISTAGQRAAENMGHKLEESLARVAAAQELMAQQLIEQQKQSSEVMDVTVRSVLMKLQSAVASLASERAEQIAQDEQRHERMMQSAEVLYKGLSQSVTRFVDEMDDTTEKSHEALASVQATALHAISGMTSGANIMREAADRFVVAGTSITDLTNAMSDTASVLQTTAQSLRQAFEDQERNREVIQSYVAELYTLVDTIKREAGVNQDLVGQMEHIVSSLADVERQSQEHMERINEVLKKSFRDFGIEMVGQVRHISEETNRQMDSSLNVLSDTVESVISSVTKLRRVS